MLKRFLSFLLSNFSLFNASYSNNVFKDPLSKEEEEECIRKLELGDQEARAKLIEHNLRLVAHLVKKYDTKLEDQDDLISIGTIGLIKGVDSYSSDRKVKITTYCAKCIENEILMFFRANNKNLKNISLNESIGFDKEGNEITVLDVLKTSKPDFLEEMDRKENIQLLIQYLDVLTPREKEIVIRRYGLIDNNCQTQKIIARELKISRSYVSRIEKRALTKILREFLRNNKDFIWC